MIVVEYMTALNMALKMSTEIAARERKVWDIQKDFICELEAGSFYVDDPEISGQENSGQGAAGSRQQKGKWLWDEEEDRCYCSECGEEDDKNIDGVYMMHDFCPNCGADMRGE